MRQSAAVILAFMMILTLGTPLGAQEALAPGEELMSQAQTAYGSGNFSAAIDYLLKARTAYGKSAPGDGDHNAIIATWLGACYFQMKNYAASIRQFEGALAFFKARHDAASQVAVINGLAGSLQAAKKYDQLIVYYKQAAAICGQAGEKENQAIYLTLIADAYYKHLQKPKEAITYYSAAADGYAALKNDRETFNNLNNIAGVYFYSGEKAKALASYQRAWEAGKTTLSPAEVAPFLNNIASIAMELKKFGDAAAWFQLLYDTARESASPSEIFGICRNLGATYSKAEKKEAALKYYRLARDAGREDLTREDRIDILVRIAETAGDLNDVKTAIACYEELAQLHEAAQSWEELARVYNNLGYVSHQAADDRAAVAFYKRAEDLSGRLKDQALLSGIYYNSGLSYDALENYPQSLAYLQKYIAREDKQGEKNIRINARLLAGSACFHQSLFQDALAYYRAAEKTAVGYEKKAFLASVYQHFGELYAGTAAYAQALDYNRKALAHFEKSGRRDACAVLLGDTGAVYTDMADYGRALESFNRALALNKTLGNEKQIAAVNNNIGRMYHEMGEFDKALAFMRLGMAYSEKSGDRGNYAITLNNVGDVYRLWGNTGEALRYYEAALKIAAELERADVRATVCNNLGMLYKAMEDFPKALEMFEQALALNRELKNRRYLAANLSNIGETHRLLRDYRKAYQYALDALALDEEIGIPSVIARRLNNIALLYADNLDFEKSNAYLLKTLKHAGAGNQVDLATYYGNLGFNYCQLKEYASAIVWLDKAVALKEKLRNTAQGTDRMEYLASQLFTYQNLAFTHAAAGNAEEALHVAELSRAKYLAEKISDRGGLSAAYPGVARFRKSIDDDTVVIGFSNVGKYFVPLRTVLTRDQIEVRELNPEALAIDAAVMEEIKAANGKTRGLKVTAGSTTTARKDAAAADNEYFYDKLSHVVYHFRSLLLNPEIDFLKESRAYRVARALHDFLLGDLKGLLATKKKIIVVPDNILGLLPFETLIDDGQHYLVETHDVRYEHSLTVMTLVNERRYAGDRWPLLAFGGAVYEEAAGAPADAPVSETELAETAARAGRGEGRARIYAYLKDASWQDLPGTLAEVTAIGGIYGKATIVTGGQVSEENVKALSKSGALRQYQVIHFATHGLTVPDYPELSSLVLSLGGGKKTGGDGYLQAPEIAGLDLKADFVNLSACETGLGKIYGGEGIVGLSQSFLIAGANGVSVSLWAVADEPTMKFMTNFYSLIKDKGLTYAAAEAAVKRAFIKDPAYRHPYFWAPFVYYGK